MKKDRVNPQQYRGIAEDGEWYYGSLVRLDNEEYLITDFYGDMHVVDEDTIGLLSSDTMDFNGNDVYQGDILKNEDGEVIGHVDMVGGVLHIIGKEGSISMAEFFKSCMVLQYTFYVSGNIHNNVRN